jgi:hypothetical protein
MAVLMLAALAAGCGPGANPPRANPAPKPEARRAETSGKPKLSPRATRPSNPKPERDPTKKPEPNPAVAATAEEGVIRGAMVWKGKAPGSRLLVGSTGGVADGVVWLLNPPGAAAPAPEGLSLMQTRGQLRLRSEGGAGARVQVASPGSTLHLATTDDRADFVLSGAAGFARTVSRGGKASVPLLREGLVEVRSEGRQSPAYVHVLKHAYHAVTGSDGTFSLPKVPPGEYRVHFWHEGWPTTDAADTRPARLTVPVKLAAGQGARLTWTLSSWSDRTDTPARD